jgi:ppGpp synthetase/RelA/SpoT-type nucleotidyltranferase
MAVPQFVPPWGWLQEMLGLSWPQGDEDALRRCGAAWKEACDSLMEAAGYGNDVVANVNSAIVSVSCDQFNAYWNRYVKSDGILDQLAGQCAAMANYADSAALEIEATKISEDVVAVILYIQILEALLEIAASFGLDTPLVAAQMAAERWAAQSALRMLIKGLIESLAFTLLPDLIAETVQMVEGNRPWGDFDGSRLLHDFEHGLALGALFALPGLGGRAAQRFGWGMPAFAKPLLDNAFTNNPFVRKAAAVGYGGVSMVGGNAAVYYLDHGIQGLGAKGWADGENSPFQDWQKSLLQGMVLGGIHTSKDWAKEQIATPRMAIDTTGGDSLLLHRFGGGIDPGGADHLTVYQVPSDGSGEPSMVGRGSFDGGTGTLTVRNRDGGTTTYQAQNVLTMDRSGTPTSSVAYRPAAGGDGAHEPGGVVSFGGGDGSIPANTTVLHTPDGTQAGTAVHGDPAPGSGPVYDQNQRPVDTGAAHVFTDGQAPKVVVAGDGTTVPEGFDRPLAPNEAAAYDYGTGRLQEVYTYPADGNQIPAGHQVVWNADGTPNSVQPLDYLSRPRSVAADLSSAHSRASEGVGSETPSTEVDAAREAAVPGDITQDETFRGQNDLEALRQRYAAEHRLSAADQLSDQARRFDLQLNGGQRESDLSVSALADGQRELVGAGAAQATVSAVLGGRARDLAGGGRRPDRSGGDRPEDPGRSITAAELGPDFHGRTAPRHEVTPESVADLRDRADHVLNDVERWHDRVRQTGLGPDGEHLLADDHGSFTVRVEVAELPGRETARTYVDHVNGDHKIVVSERLAPTNVRRAMVHEISEIFKERELVDQGLRIPPDALRPGRARDGATLSPHDEGRVAELRLLAEEHAGGDPAAAREISRMVDALGLRDGSPGAEARRQLIHDRLTSFSEDVNENVTRALDDLGGHRDDPPLEAVDPGNGYRLSDRDLSFLHLTREEYENWLARRSPLGMTPDQFERMGQEAREALEADGIDPDQVLIRIVGSSTRFFSGWNKTFPSPRDIAENPSLRSLVENWFGGAYDPRPERMVWDTAYRMGISDKPSDYDTHVLSDQMVQKVLRIWGSKDPDLVVDPTSKLISNGYALREAFPHFMDFADKWTDVLGRKVGPNLSGLLHEPRQTRAAESSAKDDFFQLHAGEAAKNADPDNGAAPRPREIVVPEPETFPRPWPKDPGTGLELTDRQIEALGLTRERFENWQQGKAPLCFESPEQYEEFKRDIVQAMEADGIPASQFQAAAKGSNVRVFSRNKRLPSAAELAADPELAAALEPLRFTPDGPLPFHRPVDAEAGLGFGAREASDFDLQISSDLAVQKITAWHRQERPEDDLNNRKYGFMNRDSVADALKHLHETALHWSGVLGREVTPSVFGLHEWPAMPFKPRDWPVNAPEPGLDLAMPPGAAVHAAFEGRHPEIEQVLGKLLSPTAKPLNITQALRDPSRRAAALDTLLHMVDSSRLDGTTLPRFVADHAAPAELFHPVPDHANLLPDGTTRKDAHVAAIRDTEPAFSVGIDPTPQEDAAVQEYMSHLSGVVQGEVVEDLMHTVGDRPGLRVAYRVKDASSLYKKIADKQAKGVDYRVGDLTDMLGVRLFTTDTRQLTDVLNTVVEHYGGLGGQSRILEVTNTYAGPRAESPHYRAVHLLVSAEIDGRPAVFELQIVTARASVANDLFHDTVYKPQVDVNPAEQAEIRRLADEAAAAEQEEGGSQP